MTKQRMLLIISLALTSACKKKDADAPAPSSSSPAGAPAAKPVEDKTYELADFVARVKDHLSEWTGKVVTVKGAMSAQLTGDAQDPGGVALGPENARVDCDLAAKTPELDRMSNEVITVRGTVQKIEFGEIRLSDCRVIAGLVK